MNAALLLLRFQDYLEQLIFCQINRISICSWRLCCILFKKLCKTFCVINLQAAQPISGGAKTSWTKKKFTAF